MKEDQLRKEFEEFVLKENIGIDMIDICHVFNWFLAKRKEEMEEIRNKVDIVFSNMAQCNNNGEYKYWNPGYFGYLENDMQCSMDKMFPQEVHDSIINLLKEYES